MICFFVEHRSQSTTIFQSCIHVFLSSWVNQIQSRELSVLLEASTKFLMNPSNEVYNGHVKGILMALRQKYVHEAESPTGCHQQNQYLKSSEKVTIMACCTGAIWQNKLQMMQVNVHHPLISAASLHFPEKKKYVYFYLKNQTDP